MMTEAKWVMNRAGLLNFWYYDEEIFHFSDGKLLLRGTNGSGKSVTMQSFLPVLLDGKKSPDRLDPFGSKARRMEDYLLGEKEVVDRDERTGYLFMEYKLEGLERYITTGIGMQAKRNKGIKSWYFLLTDNRRIGHDFQLAQSYLGERIPLSAKELENRIGNGGYVVHTQQEYMELVNKYVFGFQSTEAYEDLIKLLIQLRSPKLSKDFKPTVIYEILESALPPLTDDELRHLSDTIESMDQTQQQMEQLEREFESSNRLIKQYSVYNQYILAERALQWQNSLKRKLDASHRVENLKQQHKQLSKEMIELAEKQQHFTEQKSLAEDEKERLQGHEVWRLESDKRKKQENVLALVKEIQLLKGKADSKIRLYNQVQHEREQTQAELGRQEKEIAEVLEELNLDAQDSAFSQHDVNLHDFERHLDGEFDFSVWIQETAKHEHLLASLKQLAEEEGRLTAEHDRLQRQSSVKKKEMDELRKNQDHLEQWFTEQKQQLEQQVFSWIDGHSKLNFSNDQLQEIARSIEGLYEENRFDLVREKLYEVLNEYVAELKTKKNLTDKLKEAKKEEIEVAKEELHYWKTQKMPNPDRRKDTEDSREQRKEAGQAFLPFYAAVEFQDHVTEEQKERIEAVLSQTGLLDSLITEVSEPPIHDRLIQPEPHLLGYTLADYLRPDVDEDSPVSQKLVDEVLRSIPLEREGTGFHVDIDGTYSIGCMVGHAANEGPSKYIGRSSRKRYQQEKIQEWILQIEKLTSEWNELHQQWLQMEESLRVVEEWKQSMPTDSDLLELNTQIEKTVHLLEMKREELHELDSHWKLVHQQLQMVKVQLHQAGIHLNFSLKVENISQALSAIKSYRDFVHKLNNLFQKNVYSKKRINELKSRIEEIEAEIDEIKGDQNIKESLHRKEHAEIKSIEQQLKLQGIDEVRARIQLVQQSLVEANKEIDSIRETLPQKNAEQVTNQRELEAAEISSQFWSNMAMEWEQMVRAENTRGFIEITSIEPTSILSQLDGILAKYDRSKLNEQLTKAFINEQVFLTEYRMFEYTEEANHPEWFSKEWGEYYEPFMNEWSQIQSRRLIQMEYKGQRVNPYYVNASLEKELLEQQGWLDEQDRQLYEDIIVNTVGVILRNRIQRAERWVRAMDKIMESRDNSSGLTFSIAWKPLTAESELELDTKDLVQLLQRNSKFLQEEDLQRITKHFQSRIAKAKELIQLRNEGSTLHQVLKEVLDYRKWFTFILSFKRVNEPKRELTNNAFFKFSGGEKAMAMYIPLFTAAYSRYKEASTMAPYIISLDEAFAGVDENNIRDMFEVVEQLGFNYIMNSQALWGDYDTISSLSICELVRTKNADYVTVIRYQWDGKQRSLVFEEDPGEEVAVNE